MRDHTKLKVFAMADALVPEVYTRTRVLPAEERFGLQSQIRRSALSVPTNIVEGCTRQTPRDFARFLVIALGSANEARYLIDVATRVEMLPLSDRDFLDPRYDELIRALASFIRTVES